MQSSALQISEYGHNREPSLAKVAPPWPASPGLAKVLRASAKTGRPRGKQRSKPGARNTAPPSQSPSIQRPRHQPTRAGHEQLSVESWQAQSTVDPELTIEPVPHPGRNYLAVVSSCRSVVKHETSWKMAKRKALCSLIIFVCLLCRVSDE